MGWNPARDIRNDTRHQYRQAAAHADIEHSRVAQLLLGRIYALCAVALLLQVHSPAPLASARNPAASSITMTILRIVDALTMVSSRAPINAPSIMPITDGAAMSAST